MKTFAYVILHYKNIKDTLECIKSIKEKTDSKIIIVDNHTLVDEGIKQIETYTRDIILLEENFGFAKANNIGVSYTKEKYDVDFVVVINNDIVITQPDFEQRIRDAYAKTSFDMLGPKIKTKEGDSVNPFPVYKDLTEVEKALLKTEQNISLFQNRWKRILFRIYHNIKYKLKPLKHLENGEKAVTGVGLHGCAIIFSRKYLEKYKDAFYNETFLYHEEEFLYYRTQKDHLISYYDPNIELFHKEGSSLNYTYKSNYYEKELFRNKEIKKSLKKLKDIMLNHKNI